MTDIGQLLPGPPGRVPTVRPSYRILGRAHASVTGLFAAVNVLDGKRRQGNESTKGRTSNVEIDVVRSAIILTSAGLDSSMKRLVNDVGRVLITRPGTGARHEFEEYLKRELAKPNIAPSFREAVLDIQVADRLLAHYLAERTRASFQGSSDLKVRVRQTLGIARADVGDEALTALDEFFVARNKIAHDMDLKDPASHSVAREHRDPGTIASQCDQVFRIAVSIIHGAAVACKKV